MCWRFQTDLIDSLTINDRKPIKKKHTVRATEINSIQLWYDFRIFNVRIKKSLSNRIELRLFVWMLFFYWILSLFWLFFFIIEVREIIPKSLGLEHQTYTSKDIYIYRMNITCVIVVVIVARWSGVTWSGGCFKAIKKYIRKNITPSRIENSNLE